MGASPGMDMLIKEPYPSHPHHIELQLHISNWPKMRGHVTTTGDGQISPASQLG